MSEKKFSEMLSRLEEIVTTLEKGDCELEASMELFDEGTTLAKICNEKLNNAQLKITNIVEISSGENE
ncbi:MAG: exodeoxyribonuclease VII small subunit [Clostridia bacterium]|nr:exodeoxyribonuclease VII small subunit [Clostridia bacterium]MBQ3563498.1 exodeoxyribonuclease VII small subunit [Clostridia bacterium]MBQ9958316.1 exodeoxyribonuclease VII small subunit [Clostridia bacterium]